MRRPSSASCTDDAETAIRSREDWNRPAKAVNTTKRRHLSRAALDYLKRIHHPEVKRAVLFGSLARGDHGSRSDADILLVLSESPYDRFFDRIPDFLPYFSDSDVPVDLFPYTEVEIERMESSGNMLVRRAMAEGIVID